MNVSELVSVLHDRGLRLVRKPGGDVLLRGPKEQVTPSLLNVLKLHKGKLWEHASEPEKKVAPRPRLYTPPTGAMTTFWYEVPDENAPRNVLRFRDVLIQEGQYGIDVLYAK